jgi:aspartyl-tRNA(Asn)/glutamyl-tRNA(Gln) amidotransferase subunit A
MQLTDLTLSEAAHLIQTGQITPLELTHACLDRIQQVDPKLNSFITLTAESALKEARQAGEELSSGKYHGPLHGIPLALKDLYETRSVRTTAGSLFFTHHIPEQDAGPVQRLRASGAILLGKLNMHEIAFGVTTVNPHFGPCLNPWDSNRISGGSSGGSAAALAGRLCYGALGSDTGGSIRIPASLCGIVGLKPTLGRVSLRGVIPLSWNLDHAGPMARTVRDAALLLQAIAGYDPADPASIDMAVDDYLGQLTAGIQGMRIACPTDEFFQRADTEVLELVEAAAGVLAELGARVERVEFPHARQAARMNGLMVASDAAAFHQKRMEESPQLFGPDVLQRLQIGAAYTSTEYALARRAQVELRRAFETFFAEFDLLLTPTTPIAAPPIAGTDAIEQANMLTRFTAPFNLTGLPAISIPCGFTSGGLPVGLQMVSRPWAEATLLRAAFAYEQATSWHENRPGSFRTFIER